jgi:hypothetical protein
MQRVTLVRYTVKPECAAENETLSRRVFDDLRAKSPEHVSYAVFRNGRDFVHLFVNLRNEDSEAITELPAFKTYTKEIAARCETPVEVIRLGAELLESYGWAGAPSTVDA